MMEPSSNCVLVALGANIAGPAGSPQETLRAAIGKLPSIGIALDRCSSFLRTKAFPPSDQPDFLNAVAMGTSRLDAPVILAGLHRIEQEMGRVREVPWGPRTLDLDLLALGEIVSEGYWAAAARGDRPGEPGGALILPHPRMHLRRFVLEPLVEIAPEWRHPALGLTAAELLRRLDARAPEG